MSQQRESLLQYQPPAEVFSQDSMGGSRQKNAQQMFDSKLAIDCIHVLIILELLTSMFPPVAYEADGKNYKKVISTNPPSREDVNTLQKMLDEKLVYRQARFDLISMQGLRHLPHSGRTPSPMLRLNNKASHHRLSLERHIAYESKRRTLHDYRSL